MHAMRGISAHSNGFHTCRAIHLLQMLLGSVDVPGGFRYKPPFPRPIPPSPKPHGKTGAKPNAPLGGMPLGFVLSPQDLLVDADNAPLRIDKAFSWEHPMASHGMLHMVISNAVNADPYPIDTLLLYMANMAWNSSMDTWRTIDMLTAKDPATGEYKIPRIIYSDAYFSETVAYADLVLPDTTYLERWDCISLLDRPISDADAACDAIRQPVQTPDRDVRCFQEVLLDLGARLRLPGMVDEDGEPKFPGGYADYIVNHERAPGIGPLAGWRGDGTQHGRGAPNAAQLDNYIDNGCFWRGEIPRDARYMKMANQGYLAWALRMGFVPDTRQIVLQLYAEPLQKFRNAARGLGPRLPPEKDRARIEAYFDPLPIWYAPLAEAAVNAADYPLHALTQRPMHHYHSWGSQNAWLRQITAQNKLFMHRERAEALGIGDDDWVWIESHAGRVKAQAKLIAGVNRDTAWTWNAIGKRAGAWMLKPDAPEAARAFLLNHVISRHLPDGERSNSDPVTGQAAWFDVRVKVTRAADHEQGPDPARVPLNTPPGLRPGPDVLRFGAEFKTREAAE
jgi:anaerobic selenocysteine-containing dehydrogenase